MKNQLILTIIFFTLITYSCKKKDDIDLINIVDITPYSNPTSYILKRQIWSGPTTNGHSFLYIYNSQNLISKIERYQWGTYTIDGGPTQKWYDTSYYSFEYTKGLCSKWTLNEGANGIYIYSYNSQNLPVNCTIYNSGNNIQSYRHYKYDGSNNLIEVIDSLNKVNTKYEFSYNNDNNLVSVIKNDLASNPQKKAKYEYTSFDDNVNFIKAVNGLPISFVWDNNFHSYSSSSSNNFINVNYYIPVNSDQDFGSPITTNYSYKYNDKELPIKMSYAAWVVNFEYEKYK